MTGSKRVADAAPDGYNFVLGAVSVPEDRATPDYLGQFVKSEIEKWAGPIKASGVTVD